MSFSSVNLYGRSVEVLDLLEFIPCYNALEYILCNCFKLFNLLNLVCNATVFDNLQSFSIYSLSYLLLYALPACVIRDYIHKLYRLILPLICNCNEVRRSDPSQSELIGSSRPDCLFIALIVCIYIRSSNVFL